MPDLDNIKFTPEQISQLFERGINSFSSGGHEAAYQLLAKFAPIYPDIAEGLFKKAFYHAEDWVQRRSSYHLHCLTAAKPEAFLTLYQEAIRRYIETPLAEYIDGHHPLLGSLANLASVDQALFEETYHKLLQKALNEPMYDIHKTNDYIHKIVGTLNGLVSVNPGRAASLIKDHLHHPNEEIRKTAASCLKKLFSQNPQLALPLYTLELEDEDGYVRSNAARSLTGLAPTDPNLFIELYQQGRSNFPNEFNNIYNTTELLSSLIPINPQLAVSIFEQTKWRDDQGFWFLLLPYLLAEFFKADPKIGVTLCARFVEDIRIISEFLARPAAHSFFAPLRVLLVEQLKIAPEDLTAAVSSLQHSLENNLGPEGFIDAIANWQVIRAMSEKVQTNPSLSEGFKKMFTMDAAGLQKSVISDQELDAIGQLMAYGIFPTPPLRRYIAENGASSIDELLSLKGQTEKGLMAPDNELQTELEFTHYLALLEKDNVDKNTYHSFKDLMFLSTPDAAMGLSGTERREAKAAAYEAERVFRLVEKLIQNNRKVIVIGNNRYGSYYVTQPLEDYLNKLAGTGLLLGVHTSHIKSSDAGSHSPFHLFPNPSEQAGFMKIIAAEQPDILFIDGTSKIRENKLPRMPGSMLQVLNWALAYNNACEHKTPLLEEYVKHLVKTDFEEAVTALKDSARVPYRIRHFTGVESQDISDYISVGNETVMGRSDPVFSQGGKPQLILVNSVCDPVDAHLPRFLENHQPGFLDDLDNHLEITYALTNNGVQKLYAGRTEEQLLSAIQEVIRQELQRLIGP